MRMINCNVVVHDNYHRCIRKLWHSKDKVMMMLGGKLLPGWSVVGIYALVEDDQSSLISRGSSRSPFSRIRSAPNIVPDICLLSQGNRRIGNKAINNSSFTPIGLPYILTA